jgi:hypothetical protein
MKIKTLGFVALFIASCSAAPKQNDFKKNGPGGTDNVSTDGTNLPDSEGIDAQGVSGNELQLISPEGSSMSFLDSKALTLVYSRVFKKGAVGWMHCVSSKPTDILACDDIFAPAERSTLGTFDIYNPAMNRGEHNINRVSNVSLNYVRSLRAGLSRECANLVTGELAAFKAGTGATNILVKADLPTAATIEEFFRRILDIKNNPEIVVDIDASGYASDFPKSVALMTDKNKATYNAYLNLCISIGMDPQVFLY